MITFKPITIEDKAEIESFTLPYAPANCDLAFANMFCWQFQFKTGLESKIAKEKQFNKQVALNNELRKLKKELEALK